MGKFLLAYVFLVFGLIAEVNAQPVNINASGVLLDGYDVVAYFSGSEPVRGKSQFRVTYQGSTLFFSTQENKETFNADPEKYYPQYSGHCANGLSDGHLVRANPEIFRIIDGKLYLFYSWWGKAQWKFDQQEQIELANKYWSEFSTSGELTSD